MLPMGGITDVNGNLTNKFSDWKTEEEQVNNLPSPMNWASSRMVFVAANSPDDIASAAAGVIAGVDPWVSLILKPVDGIGINGDLSDGAVRSISRRTRATSSSHMSFRSFILTFSPARGR